MPEEPQSHDTEAGGAPWGKRTRDPAERLFLEGARPRLAELFRAIRIFVELMRGFRRLHFVGPCVTVFGSARFPESHPYYQLARAAGAELGRAGFTVMTGGGPGIMEAANRGARDVGARSVGCNIILPHEQKPNPFLDDFVEFRYFFVRKLMLIKYSHAFIAAPGGFGTLDEIFETATLIQTAKIANFPLVLMGRAFWQPMLDFLQDTMVREGTISEHDVRRLFVTDDPAEAVTYIKDATANNFGLRYGKPPKARWWMFER